MPIPQSDAQSLNFILMAVRLDLIKEPKITGSVINESLGISVGTTCFADIR